MKATVNWQKDLAFFCETDSGHSMVLDGAGQAMSPMESVLMSVGACSSVDVVEIMKKSRQPLRSCRCELSAKRAESAPRVFTHIHAHYYVSGDNISDKQLARAVSLSCEKYCSVMLMLTGNVEISTAYSIE